MVLNTGTKLYSQWQQKNSHHFISLLTDGLYILY